MLFKIVEFDRDYHVITDIEYKEFDTEEAALKYAKAESWTGYDYYAYKVENNT